MTDKFSTRYLNPQMATDAELTQQIADVQAQLNDIFAKLPDPELKFVNAKSDFPEAINGVITLADNVTYFITKTVDLTGDRLVGGQNTTIIGGSSENCILKSTGLDASTALLSSNWSIPMRNISISHGTAINLDATGNPNQALDWSGLNFLDCGTVGLVRSFTNFIMSDCALLNSANMTFDGTIGTVGFQQCLFSGIAGQTTLNFPSTLTITRRIRAIYSSFVVFGGATAIYVDPLATIPTEAYILDTINFSGGATYTGGVTYLSNTAFFLNCKGIVNTSSIAQMHFNANITATDIIAAGTYVKIAGTTIPATINQKFNHGSNKLTYSGGIVRSFKVTSLASLTAGNANEVSLAVFKNGVFVDGSEATATVSGNGRFENLKSHVLLELQPNDFVEMYVKNSSNVDVTVQELNVIIEALN